MRPTNNVTGEYFEAFLFFSRVALAFEISPVLLLALYAPMLSVLLPAHSVSPTDLGKWVSGRQFSWKGF